MMGLDIFEVVLRLIARHKNLTNKDFFWLNKTAATRNIDPHRSLSNCERRILVAQDMRNAKCCNLRLVSKQIIHVSLVRRHYRDSRRRTLPLRPPRRVHVFC